MFTNLRGCARLSEISIFERTTMSTPPGKLEKTKALEAALKQIERSFGKGSVMKLGEQSGNGEI